MTATAVQSKDALKALLIEIATDDPTFFNHLVQKSQEAQENAPKKEVEQIIKETFEEYDDVFKALA